MGFPRGFPRSFASLLLSLLLLAPLAPACSGSDAQGETSGGGGSCAADVATLQKQIFLRSCAQAGCHAADKSAAGLDLETGDVAGRGVDLCSGTKMPKLSMLPASEIQTIADWICEGAPDN